MGAKLVNIDRKTPLLLAVDLREWVEGDDFVHFVIEAVEGLDLRGVPRNERGSGSAQYPAGMMLALLVYSYACGVFSSRKIERSTHLNVAVRYLCADTHPDHDTIAAFRQRHLKLVENAFLQVLKLAKECGVLQMGTICVDGTKLKAAASKKANVTAEQLLQLEVAERLKQADLADQQAVEEGTRLPKALADRKTRAARLEAAREVLARRAGVSQQPQVNTTDPDSRLQPPSHRGGGFVQGYNAQAAVERGPARLIVGSRIADTTIDLNQLSPMLAQLPAELGRVETVVTDRGYDSHQDLAQAARQGVHVCCPPAHPVNPQVPREAQRRARHADRVRRQAASQSPAGQALLLWRRTTIEPIFGLIKETLGFRRFHLRGLAAVTAEWRLVCLAYNLRRLWRFAPA